MSDANLLKPDSSAVMKHIDLYQGIINRMAGNSAACKQWAIGLVSAILILVAEKGKVELTMLAIIPAILFGFLDAYYLALEQQFREVYSQFIKDLHAGNLSSNALYRVKTNGKLPETFRKAFFSLAIWPFYGGMVLLVVAARWVVG
ncbi:MAG: hypothetical protein PHX24_06415 [Acidithiobacillus sp.]|nr:hypothetical protein [Acidithiobacillus sp.]